MSFEPGFALGDQFGADVFLGGAELDDALHEAKSIYRDQPVFFDGDLYTVDHQGGEDFSPNAGDMVRRSMAASGLDTYSADEVMSLSLSEAHAILLPYFRRRIHGGQHKGKMVKAYDSVRNMQTNFLTANAKLMKGIKGKGGIKPGLSRGPNLLPHRLVAEVSRKKKLSSIGLPNQRINLCVGSNAACRATCLVYSGNNPTADSQVPAKLSRTEALLREPVAWLRTFVGSIEWHIEWCRSKKLVPYIRPNVLSDLPWEIIFPDLFELFPKMWFYDYTKVAGRAPEHDNYDLTFSFSGSNARQVASELRRGVRTAVVFWLEKPCSRFPHPPCDTPADLTFMGQPVIDGDLHDFRPLDPPGSVIGLSYKVPTRKKQRMPVPPPVARKFVVPTFRDTDTNALIVAGVPAQLGAEDVFEHAGPTQVE